MNRAFVRLLALTCLSVSINSYATGKHEPEPPKTNPSNPSSTSTSTSGATSSSTSSARQRQQQRQQQLQQQRQNQRQQQQQNMNGSGNGTASATGGASHATGGASNATAGVTGSGNSESASSAVTGPSSADADIDITGDVVTYAAPTIPVATAAPSFATICTQGMAGQTVRIAFSQSSITMQCKFLLDGDEQFRFFERTWISVNMLLVPQLEGIEAKRARLQALLDTQNGDLVRKQDEYQAGIAKGSVKFSEHDRSKDIRTVKLNVASIEAEMAKLDQDQEYYEGQISFMILQAQTAYGRSAKSMERAHLVISSKSERVTTFLATMAQNLFAPLGFLVVAQAL